MIDRKWIGYASAPATTVLEAADVQRFARAIGETDPVYGDAQAAARAGHPGLPVPPTFLMCPEFRSGGFYAMLDALGIGRTLVLHAEQRFRYRRVLCAGEAVTIASRVADIVERARGALEFVVLETRVTDAHGAEVAELRGVHALCHVPQRERTRAPGREHPCDETLAPTTFGPIDRAMLQRFAEASGDLNPLHLDAQFAREAGLADVIAHGMLGMAWLGRCITARFDQRRLRRFSVRFLDMIRLGDTLASCVHAREADPDAAEHALDLALLNQRGQVALAGEAILSPER